MASSLSLPQSPLPQSLPAIRVLSSFSLSHFPLSQDFAKAGATMNVAQSAVSRSFIDFRVVGDVGERMTARGSDSSTHLSVRTSGNSSEFSTYVIDRSMGSRV